MGRSDGCARLVVAVCVVDRNARFVYVSAASKRILGYEPHELIGTPMIDLVFPARIRSCAWHKTCGGWLACDGSTSLSLGNCIAR